MLYWMLRPVLWLWYKIFYRVKVFGKENLKQSGKSIVISNHLGKMDVFLVGALFKNKTYFLAKEEWFKNKFFGYVLKKLGAIPINRDKPSASSFKNCLEVLKNDKRLAIFPEGTRNKENTSIQAVKQGTSFFAVKGQSLITPVIIFDRLKPFKTGYCIIGEPLSLEKFYDKPFRHEQQEEATEIIEKTMEELQKELEEKVNIIKRVK